MWGVVAVKLQSHRVKRADDGLLCAWLGRIACRRPVRSDVQPTGRDARPVECARAYSSAPPEAGRGVTTSNNQTFCKAPCMANIRPTMIELLSAWNSHEYATFFPDFTYTSVRMMLSGR